MDGESGDFFARSTDPETSHIQMGKMDANGNLRGYLRLLFLDAGCTGLTGKEVQKFIPQEQHQSHFRLITDLRRTSKVLVKIPERRAGGQVHIHAEHLDRWIRESEEGALIAFKRLEQY